MAAVGELFASKQMTIRCAKNLCTLCVGVRSMFPPKHDAQRFLEFVGVVFFSVVHDFMGAMVHRNVDGALGILCINDLLKMQPVFRLLCFCVCICVFVSFVV